MFPTCVGMNRPRAPGPHVHGLGLPGLRAVSKRIESTYIWQGDRATVTDVTPDGEEPVPRGPGRRLPICTVLKNHHHLCPCEPVLSGLFSGCQEWVFNLSHCDRSVTGLWQSKSLFYSHLWEFCSTCSAFYAEMPPT